MAGKTLYDKLWDAHVVHAEPDGSVLLYIDRHLIHEVTSPQAFEGLSLSGRRPWRTVANLAVADHNVPTTDRSVGIADPVSRRWRTASARRRSSTRSPRRRCRSASRRTC